MRIETGYLYFLKDEFYDKINDETIMSNKGKGHSRPTYFTIRDKNILWFIPLSTQVEKYERILREKEKANKSVDYILIRRIADKKSAILIQNAFPTLEKYVEKPFMRKGKQFMVPMKVQNRNSCAF